MTLWQGSGHRTDVESEDGRDVKEDVQNEERFCRGRDAVERELVPEKEAEGRGEKGRASRNGEGDGEGEGDAVRKARTELIETLLATPAERRSHVLDMALRAANVPPQGRLESATPPASQTATPADTRSALEALKAELREKNPDWNEKRIRRTAATQAPARFPNLPWSL